MQEVLRAEPGELARSPGSASGSWALAHSRSPPPPPPHCLSSRAQTCCGQPVRPLVFLSLLLTVLFKISFWAEERRKGEKCKEKFRRETWFHLTPALFQREKETVREGEQEIGGGTFSSPSFCRKAMKMCAVLAALATARPPCACNAQLPDRQAYKQPAISKSFMEELGAFFSLTPDVGARVGVGAKSGLPVFNGSPWFALWGKWA